MVVRGMGNVWGVLGRILLFVLPEILRYTVELAESSIRPAADRTRGYPHALVPARTGIDDALPPPVVPSTRRKRELPESDQT